MTRRAVLAIEENGLLVLLLCSLVLVLLLLTQSLMVADSWMTLVSGREIWSNGFVTRETLTVFGLGREWIDQQWLAHLFFYGLASLGGLRLVLLANVVLIGSAYGLAAAAARHRGASERSTLLLAAVVFVAAPWAWQVRAQALALPLFVATLWLLVAHQARPGRRTLLVLPILVVWANVHGTVVLGVLLAAAAGVLDLARRRGDMRVAAALLALSPLCVLASPYAAELPGYYHLMLVDPPFEGLIIEWRPTRPEWKTLVFFGLAAAALVLVVWQRRRLRLFELLALLVTFYVGIDAIRGIPWFALTALVVLPVLLDGATGWRQPAPRRAVNRVLAGVSAAGVAVAFGVTAAQPGAWFEAQWPRRALPLVERRLEEPGTRLYAMAEYADWFLWNLPQLRGRVAYDVRFEIYPRAAIERTADFTSMARKGWQHDADGFALVAVERTGAHDHVPTIRATGRKLVFATAEMALLAGRGPVGQ